MAGGVVVAAALSEAAQTLLACVSDSLSDDLRPVCKTYQTQGTPVIFDCCECDDVSNGEISIHLRRLFDADASTLTEVRRVRPCRGGVIAAQFRIVLARCRPVITDRGELPDPEVLSEFANDQIRDIEIIWRSLTCCTDLGMIRVDDVSVDLSEPGLCSIVYADITVPVVVPALSTSL